MSRVDSPKTFSYLEGKIIKETEAAILFKFNGSAEWFPISQCSEIHRDIEIDLETTGDQIKVADWLLNKKGISL